MELFLNYLITNPLIAIFLCLGLGYLLGNIKIKAFRFGATASTLLIGIALSLLAKEYGGFQIDEYNSIIEFYSCQFFKNIRLRGHIYG